MRIHNVNSYTPRYFCNRILTSKHSLTNECYIDVLNKLKASVCRRTGNLQSQLIFQDGAYPHIAKKVTAKFN